eukprot:scaffold2519_cov168-Amphora_coffeaeformis.AAC.21
MCLLDATPGRSGAALIKLKKVEYVAAGQLLMQFGRPALSATLRLEFASNHFQRSSSHSVSCAG